MAFSEETIQQVWEKATPVAGNDPAVWRQDQCKAWIGRRWRMVKKLCLASV